MGLTRNIQLLVSLVKNDSAETEWILVTLIIHLNVIHDPNGSLCIQGILREHVVVHLARFLHHRENKRGSFNTFNGKSKNES